MSRESDKKLIQKIQNKKFSSNSLPPYTTLNSIEEVNKCEFDRHLVVVQVLHSNESLRGVLLLSNSIVYYLPRSVIESANSLQLNIISYDSKQILFYLNSFNLKINVCWDCVLAEKILDENLDQYSLEFLYSKYSNNTENFEINKIRKIYLEQKKILNKDNDPKLSRLYRHLELKCVSVLSKLECTKIRVDEKYIDSNKEKYSNISKHVNNGYINYSLNQYGSKTGRIYTNSPNLQTLGKEKHKVLKPHENCVFISADYKQEEVRILASLCKDEKLLNFVKSGYDVYSQIGSKLFGITYEECVKNKDFRNKAKLTIISVIYGISSKELSNKLKIEYDEAEDLINKLHTIFPGIDKFRQSVIQKLNKCHYVESVLGRRRRFSKISNLEERQAFNSVIQMSASDLLKFVLLKLSSNEELSRLGIQIILPVHDEIIFESPKSNVEKACSIIKDIMENSFEKYLHITMSCDIAVL